MTGTNADGVEVKLTLNDVSVVKSSSDAVTADDGANGDTIGLVLGNATGAEFNGLLVKVNGVSVTGSTALTDTAGTDDTVTSNGFTGVSFTVTGDRGSSLTGTNNDGSVSVDLTLDDNAVLSGADSTNAVTVAEGVTFHIGANRDQTVSVSIGDLSASALARNVSDVSASLTSLDSLRTEGALVNGMAQDALSIIDAAINEISSTRGELGAIQSNTLESNINSLKVARENLTSAESTIRDVDFAVESANFTKQQIMFQSSQAMLAQANQLPQGVLQLLG